MLTVPALIIGPPPAKEFQLGLVVSVILAAVIVTVGVTVLTWPRVFTRPAAVIGRVVHLWSGAVTPPASPPVCWGSARGSPTPSRAAGGGRLATAANRMFDYASLVAALVAFGAHTRPSEVFLAYVVSQALAIIPITPAAWASSTSA